MALAATRAIDEATLGKSRRMLATADDFVLGHLADALRSLPGDASKLTVLLRIHASLQQHIEANRAAAREGSDAPPATPAARISD